MCCIRLVILLVSTLFAALLLVPAAWALTAVTFTGPTNFAVGDGPNSVAVGDFNGDGDPDVAVANEFAGSVSVLLGGAGGGFSAATNIATGGFPFAVAVGDFNGDGDPDLAVADAFDGIISVLLGSAGGTFTGPTNFPAGSFPAAVAVGEFNGDPGVSGHGDGRPSQVETPLLRPSTPRGVVGGSTFAPNDEGERLRYAGYAPYRRTAEAMTCRTALDAVLAADGHQPGLGAGTGQAQPGDLLRRSE